MDSKKIKITRTQGEWNRLNEVVKESGKRDFKTLLRFEILQLARDVRQCEKCVSNASGEMREKAFYISEETEKALKLIAIRMKKPIGAVINEIIVSPLLQKENPRLRKGKDS